MYGNYYFDADHEGDSNYYNQVLNTHRYTRNDIRIAENQLNPKNSFTNSKVMLSTNIFIYSNGAIVGMLQSFSVSEQRQINKLQAIGWEGVVQAVPSNTRGGSLNVSRIALYDSTLYNALGLTTYAQPHNAIGYKIHNPTTADTKTDKNKDTQTWDNIHDRETATDGKVIHDGVVFRTLRDQRAPLEIAVKTRLKGNDGFYIVTYIDCWLSSYSKPYSVQTITVAKILFSQKQFT